MPMFRAYWMARGDALIEADDANEASEILEESLQTLDSSMFEQVDVDEVSTLSVKEE
jgi:hypothetical protein